jgi:MFS family permease
VHSEAVTDAQGDQYGISNIIIIGCIFLASGLGNIVGSRIAGPMADATVRRFIKKRGYRRPEDRLRAAVLGLGLIMPSTCLAYGWLLETRAGGVAPPIVFLFLQGLGLMLVFTPVRLQLDCPLIPGQHVRCGCNERAVSLLVNIR